MIKQLSRYKYGVVFLYLLVTPVIVLYAPGVFSYKLQTNQSALAYSIAGCSLVLLLIYLLRVRRLERNKNLSIAIFYGLLFAVPEEIIFRGLVQTYIQSIFHDMALAIVVSAVVFGAVHLPNRTNGWAPTKWNWKLAGLAFSGGIPLAWIFALTQSLFIPTFLHASFLVLLQMFVLGGDKRA